MQMQKDYTKICNQPKKKGERNVHCIQYVRTILLDYMDICKKAMILGTMEGIEVFL